MRERSQNNALRKGEAPRRGALRFHGSLARRTLRSVSFENIPDPVFLIDRGGAIVDANTEGRELLSALPVEGSHGAIGRRELSELFERAATRSFAPAPLRVDNQEGGRHFEARFGGALKGGLKTVIFADVTTWKRALTEKEAILHAVRAELERPIAVCARCGAIKSPGGEWGPPGGVETASIARSRLSHGLCPDCLAQELGKLGLPSAETQIQPLASKR